MTKKLFFFIFFLFPFSLQAIPVNLESGLEFYKAEKNKEAYAVFFQMYEKEHKAVYCFYLGNLSAFSQRYDEAEQWYKKGIETKEELEDSFYLNLGIVLLKQNKNGEAVFYFEKIKVKNPLLRIILSVLYYNDKNYIQSEFHIKELIQEAKSMPDDFLLSVYENYFFVSLRNNKNYQAMNIANLLKNFQDVSNPFWYNYAGVLSENSQPTKAEEIFGKLLNSPQSSSKEDIYFHLLYILIYQKKDFNKALPFAEEVFKKNQSVPLFIKLYAFVLYQLGKYEEAWKIFLPLPPVSKEDYKMKAAAAFQAGFQAESIMLLESAFLLYPDEDILSNLVSLYYLTKNYQQAELVIQFYHDRNKTDRFTLWLFQFAILAENYDKATEYGEKILSSDLEKDASFYYNMGKLYEKKSIFDKAEAVYLESKRLTPDFPYPYISLAVIYTNSGRYEEAVDSYIIAIKLLPDYGVYYYHLAQVYAMSNNYFLAKEFIKQALYKKFSKEIILGDPLFDPVLKAFPGFDKELEGL